MSSSRSAEEIVTELLELRGIPAAEHSHFLQPDFARDTHDPLLLAGMSTAVERLVVARKSNESILIFGDYDADGVPATALCLRVLKQLGYENVTGLIPRRDQGYGLTGSTLADILTHKPRVVITVDNGTVAQAEVAELAAAGIDVIVVDHHEPQEGHVATSALAIINPKQDHCTYPFRELCACALAWKLMCALAMALGEKAEALKWELDLVALSTIADMVPLLGENRVLAHYGLKVLAKTRNVGLKELAKVAVVELATVSASDVGFKLAPRINAPSRMHGDMHEGEQAALTLLTTTSVDTARKMAEYLQHQNSERQALVDAHLAEADTQALTQSHESIIVAYHPDWSTGVIGLVASRLVDKYQRPAIALANEGGSIKGSVRSIDGTHAVGLLEAAAAVLERFGGHEKAAGLTLAGSVEDFTELARGHMATLGMTLSDLATKAQRQPELSVTVAELSLELAKAFEVLEPFGIGFPAPRLSVSGALVGLRYVGAEGKHVSFMLQGEGGVTRKAIAFGYKGPELGEGASVTCIGNVQAETWRDVCSPVLHVGSVALV